MSMRISSFAALATLAVAGCAPQSAMPDGESVDCALGAGADFGSSCVLEQLGGGLFVIHHPDGSSHRFRYQADQASVVMADGAQPIIEVAIERQGSGPSDGEQTIEFATDKGRYRFDFGLLPRLGS